MPEASIPTEELSGHPYEVKPPTPQDDGKEIVNALEGYRQEAVQNRQGGLNPRDAKWAENLDLYWNRYDFSGKADWQAKETMPEVPAFVDRTAAALKEALMGVPEGFYDVVDPADKERDVTGAIKRMTDVWLSRAGRNRLGTPLHFSTVFEEQMKMGALMACASVVTWKNDTPSGRVAVETVDPRVVWLDHTNRNLYRLRRVELDRSELHAMAKAKDGGGKAIWNLPEVENLVSGLFQEEQARREEVTGHGQQVTTNRHPITLDEYIATVVAPDGRVLADRALCVVANERYLVRGPEKNPFWHGNDWLTYAPLVSAPLSVYGRSYMEDFGSLAKTFNELTNLILDAVSTSAIRSFAMVPGMLLNPGQANEGFAPNKTFLLEDSYRAEDFIKAIETGNMPSEVVTVWQMLKNQLMEAANRNEVGLGQFAPNSRTAATEIAATMQNQNAMVRALANTVETGWLDPTLDLVWKTGLQHVSKDDPALRAAAGDEMFNALFTNRRELIKRPITFQARGISQMIQRAQMLQALMQLLQIIAQSEVLLKSFLELVSPERLVQLLFHLHNIDPYKLQMTEREKLVRAVTNPLEEAQQGQGQRPGAPNRQVSDVVDRLGIGRG